MTNPIRSEVEFGLLTELYADDSIDEIMVNGPFQVYVERKGKLEQRDLFFKDTEALMRTIEGILSPLGERIDESSPVVQARLGDGSRVHVIIPPLALTGPTLTIRKLSSGVLTLNHLLTFGTLTEEMADFLRACVQARLNILIAGNVGSGKTTLLNTIAATIPDDERIVTLEETTEYRLPQKHVVALESRPPNIEGKGAVTLRDLVMTCPHMRPGRIVIGELHGREVFEVLRLMDRGYNGTMATLHADSPQDALEHLEMLIKINEPNLPTTYLRSMIGSVIDLVVQQYRLDDGSRKIVRISEVLPVKEGEYKFHDVFVFQRDDLKPGKVTGHFESHPVSPGLMRRMAAREITLPPALLPAQPESQSED